MAELLAAGTARKMLTELREPVVYRLPLGEREIPVNELLGERLRLRHTGAIHCVHCGRKTRKSFNQGYCYPCFQRLARCDGCIVSPHKCHYHAGTCREPAWADSHCMIDHYVYLANTSGVKVGITRGGQAATRWMDQGATQALPVLRVASRLHSGLAEVAFARHVADKTNWRAMLKGPPPPADLADWRERLLAACAGEIETLQAEHGPLAIQILEPAGEVRISYPVREYPGAVSAFNLDRNPLAGGRLMGIKGQYLLFDAGVVNVRKYGGYELELSLGGEPEA